MKDLFKMLLIVVVVTLPLAGCFKSPEEKAAEEVAEQMADAFGDLAKLGEGMEDMSEEELADSFSDMMKLGAEMEMAEFENQESLDLPGEMPRDYVYVDSKITGVTNYSSGDETDVYVELRTAASVDDVKTFYRGLIKDSGDWEVGPESIDSGYYSLSGSKTDGDSYESIDVTIYSNDFSELVDVDLSYTAY